MKVVAVFSALLVLVAAAGTALAGDIFPGNFHKPGLVHPFPGKFHKPGFGVKGGRFGKPNYHYAYGIKDKFSGVNVDVQENRKGDRTEGAYASALPDGRTQVVKYWVDRGSGFNADVKYFGVAKHPVPIKKIVKPVNHFPQKVFKHVAHVPHPGFKLGGPGFLHGQGFGGIKQGGPGFHHGKGFGGFPHGKGFGGFKQSQGFPAQLFFQKPAFKPHFGGKYGDDY